MILQKFRLFRIEGIYLNIPQTILKRKVFLVKMNINLSKSQFKYMEIAHDETYFKNIRKNHHLLQCFFTRCFSHKSFKIKKYFLEILIFIFLESSSSKKK